MRGFNAFILVFLWIIQGCAASEYKVARVAAWNQAGATFGRSVSDFTLEIVDEVTMTKVPATIVITPVDAMEFPELLKKSIQPLWCLQGPRKRLISTFTKAVEKHREMYVGGSKQKYTFETNGHISLLVSRGATYHVQTFHPDYQYMATRITMKTGTVHRQINLKDKGMTVRIDFSR